MLQNRLSPISGQGIQNRVNLQPLAEDPSATFSSVVGQLVGGFVQGFTTLDVTDDEPDHWLESLAHTMGYFAGFVGIIPGVGTATSAGVKVGVNAAKGAARGIKILTDAKKVATTAKEAIGATKVGAAVSRGLTQGVHVGKYATRVESVPFFLSNRIMKKGKDLLAGTKADKLAAQYLGKHKDRVLDMVEGGMNLGLASGISSWQGGIDQMMMSAAWGGFFGAGDRYISGIRALAGSGKEMVAARALAGSLFNGVPSTLTGQPFEVQVFDYMIGAFFGTETPFVQRKASQVLTKYMKEGKNHFDIMTKYKELPEYADAKNLWGEENGTLIQRELENQVLTMFGKDGDMAHIFAHDHMRNSRDKLKQELMDKGMKENEAEESATKTILGNPLAAKAYALNNRLFMERFVDEDGNISFTKEDLVQLRDDYFQAMDIISGEQLRQEQEAKQRADAEAKKREEQKKQPEFDPYDEGMELPDDLFMDREPVIDFENDKTIDDLFVKDLKQEVVDMPDDGAIDSFFADNEGFGEPLASRDAIDPRIAEIEAKRQEELNAGQLPNAPDYVREEVDRNVKFNQGLLESVRDLAYKGKTLTEISRELGVDKDVVNSIRTYLQIPSMDSKTEFIEWKKKIDGINAKHDAELAALKKDVIEQAIKPEPSEPVSVVKPERKSDIDQRPDESREEWKERLRKRAQEAVPEFNEDGSFKIKKYGGGSIAVESPAPDIDINRVDWDKSTGGTADASGVKRVKLLEANGRNRDGDEVGVVRIFLENGSDYEAGVIFKDPVPTPQENPAQSPETAATKAILDAHREAKQEYLPEEFIDQLGEDAPYPEGEKSLEDMIGGLIGEAPAREPIQATPADQLRNSSKIGSAKDPNVGNGTDAIIDSIHEGRDVPVVRESPMIRAAKHLVPDVLDTKDMETYYDQMATRIEEIYNGYFDNKTNTGDHVSFQEHVINEFGKYLPKENIEAFRRELSNVYHKMKYVQQVKQFAFDVSTGKAISTDNQTAFRGFKDVLVEHRAPSVLDRVISEYKGVETRMQTSIIKVFAESKDVVDDNGNPIGKAYDVSDKSALFDGVPEMERLMLVHHSMKEHNQVFVGHVKAHGKLVYTDALFDNANEAREYVSKTVEDTADYQRRRERYVKAVSDAYTSRGEQVPDDIGDWFDISMASGIRLHTEIINPGYSLADIQKGNFIKNGTQLNKRMQLLYGEGYWADKDAILGRGIEDLTSDGLISISINSRNKNGMTRAMGVEDQTFSVQDEDGKIIDIVSEANTDGAVFYRDDVYQAYGMDGGFDSMSGVMKSIIAGGSKMGGMLLSKHATFKANPAMSKWMHDNGIHVIYHDTATKQLGERTSYDSQVVDGKLEVYEPGTTNKLEDVWDAAFYTPIDAISHNLTTRETIADQLADQIIVKQLLRNLTAHKVNQGVINQLKEIVDRSVKGNDEENAKFQEVKKLGGDVQRDSRGRAKTVKWSSLKSKIAKINLDKVSLAQVKDVLDNPRNYDPVIYDAIVRHIFGYKKRVDPEDAFHMAAFMERDILGPEKALLGLKDVLITPEMIGSNQLKNAFDARVRSYISDRLDSPVAPYSMKSIGTPTTGFDRQIARGHFRLGRAAKDFKVRSRHFQKDMTLEKLWYEYENATGKAKEAIGKDLEMIVIRVPADSVSGSRVLRFDGFSDYDGAGSQLHSEDMAALGGMDLDIDSVFIYQDLGKDSTQDGVSLHDELKRNQDEWVREVEVSDDKAGAQDAEQIFNKGRKDPVIPQKATAATKKSKYKVRYKTRASESETSGYKVTLDGHEYMEAYLTKDFIADDGTVVDRKEWVVEVLMNSGDMRVAASGSTRKEALDNFYSQMRKAIETDFNGLQSIEGYEGNRFDFPEGIDPDSPNPSKDPDRPSNETKRQAWNKMASAFGAEGLKNLKKDWGLKEEPMALSKTGTKKRVIMESKSKRGAEFMEVKDMPKEERGILSLFDPYILTMIGKNATKGKDAVGYAASARTTIASFHANDTIGTHIETSKWIKGIDRFLDTSATAKDSALHKEIKSLVGMKSAERKAMGYHYELHVEVNKRDNIDEFFAMAREAMNYSADSSDVFDMLEPSRISDKLFGLAYETKAQIVRVSRSGKITKRWDVSDGVYKPESYRIHKKGLDSLSYYDYGSGRPLSTDQWLMRAALPNGDADIKSYTSSLLHQLDKRPDGSSRTLDRLASISNLDIAKYEKMETAYAHFTDLHTEHYKKGGRKATSEIAKHMDTVFQYKRRIPNDEIIRLVKDVEKTYGKILQYQETIDRLERLTLDDDDVADLVKARTELPKTLGIFHMNVRTIKELMSQDFNDMASYLSISRTLERVFNDIYTKGEESKLSQTDINAEIQRVKDTITSIADTAFTFKEQFQQITGKEAQTQGNTNKVQQIKDLKLAMSTYRDNLDKPLHREVFDMIMISSLGRQSYKNTKLLGQIKKLQNLSSSDEILKGFKDVQAFIKNEYATNASSLALYTEAVGYETIGKYFVAYDNVVNYVENTQRDFNEQSAITLSQLLFSPNASVQRFYDTRTPGVEERSKKILAQKVNEQPTTPEQAKENVKEFDSLTEEERRRLYGDC